MTSTLTHQDNPLLDFSGLACFDKIKPEHVTPAIAELLEQASIVTGLLEVPEISVSWESFVAPLENVTEKLGRA